MSRKLGRKNRGGRFESRVETRNEAREGTRKYFAQVAQEAHDLQEAYLKENGREEIQLAMTCCQLDITLHMKEATIRHELMDKGEEVEKRWQVAPGVCAKARVEMMKLVDRKIALLAKAKDIYEEYLASHGYSINGKVNNKREDESEDSEPDRDGDNSIVIAETAENMVARCESTATTSATKTAN